MNALKLAPASGKIVYPQLLLWASRHAAMFHMVLRHGLDFHPTAKRKLKALSPYIVSDRLTSNWAGTVAHDKARVLEYRVTDSSLATLAEESGVFSWLYPALPEDLAFFTADGRCVFNSVSHHEEAWVCDAHLAAFIRKLKGRHIRKSRFTVHEVTFSARNR